VKTSRPLVTLYMVVAGPIYERYSRVLLDDARERFLPGRCELVVLPGLRRPAGRESPPLWSHISATRYQMAVEHQEILRGEYVFQIDADMRIVADVGEEILCDGITTSIHPGVATDLDPARWPYERNPLSAACVPYGEEGPQYHPGCFIGGKRDVFFDLAAEISTRVSRDLAAGIFPAWYEESHLNRLFVDQPATLVLPREYCWWAHWTPMPGVTDTYEQARLWAAAGAKLVHLDKTGEEFEARG